MNKSEPSCLLEVFVRVLYHHLRLFLSIVALYVGANAGIGKETTKEFARRGARVIMACRNLTKAKQACAEIVGKSNLIEIISYIFFGV